MRGRPRFQDGLGPWFSVNGNGYFRRSHCVLQAADAPLRKTFQRFGLLIRRLEETFNFIFAIAVVHMLVLDEDRDGFYRFIRSHLTAEGKALICTMGDGEFEMQSDISIAFTLQERNHDSGKMMVAGTSCRMVSWNTLENELARNGLTIIEKGITSSLPDFNCLMYAVVKA